MSMVFCPECGHEISANAPSCPNCGHPMQSPPVIEKKVIVAQPPREHGIPPWAFIPLGLLVIVVVFLAYLMIRQSGDQANTNVNINMAGRRASPEPSTYTTTVPPSGETQPVTISGQTTTVPGTATSASTAPSDKGTVVINAKIAPPRGSTQAAKGTRFYLLDKDPETILSEARIDP